MSQAVSIRISAMIFLVMALAMRVQAEPQEAIDCDSRTSEVGGSEAALSQRIAEMELLREHCSGSGVLEARLAYLYGAAGLYAEADALILQGLSFPSPYEMQLRSAQTNLALRQGRLDQAEQYARDLVAAFPEWAGSYAALGEVLLASKQDVEGIEALETANSLLETSKAHLLLTMAHFNLENYLESAQALQRSLKMDINGLKHTNAICAGSLSLLALGHVSAGQELLDKHLELVPDAINSKNIQYTLSKYQQSQQSN